MKTSKTHRTAKPKRPKAKLKAHPRRCAPVSGSARTLAKRIAQSLFTNAYHQEAQRLVLEMPNGQDGGGWCKSAATDYIERLLKAQND